MSRIKLVWLWKNPFFVWVEAAWIVIGILAQLRDEFLPEWADAHVYSILPQLDLPSWVTIFLVIALVGIIEAWFTQAKTLAAAERKSIILVGYTPPKTPRRGVLRKYFLPIGSLAILGLSYQFWPRSSTVDIGLPPANGKLLPVHVATVRDIYNSDFRLLWRFASRHLVVLPDGTRWNVQQKMLADWNTMQYSISVFIPSSRRSYQFVEWAASGYSGAIGDVLANVSVRRFHPARGLNITLADLHFSGRVYLYHEDDISRDRKEILSELFRRNNAQVIYRGLLEVQRGTIEQ